jgi:hypothetical protein
MKHKSGFIISEAARRAEDLCETKNVLLFRMYNFHRRDYLTKFQRKQSLTPGSKHSWHSFVIRAETLEVSTRMHSESSYLKQKHCRQF